ncbi:unnamed protein product, partial [Didymodactylos carnosus]
MGCSCTAASQCAQGHCLNNACNSFSCFLGSTQILMWDGTTISIENAQVGMVLVGLNNENNTVLAVRKETLGDRPLYGLNSEDEFITPEHPFISVKNLSVQLVFDLTTANQVRPDLIDRTEQIEIGSELYRWNSTTNTLDITTVQSITKTYSYSRNTTLYQLITDSPSGVMSIVANGYLTATECSKLAFALADKAYQSILNQVGSPLPQPTTQYLSVWHQIAVPIVAQFQNGRVHSG